MKLFNNTKSPVVPTYALRRAMSALCKRAKIRLRDVGVIYATSGVRATREHGWVIGCGGRREITKTNHPGQDVRDALNCFYTQAAWAVSERSIRIEGTKMTTAKWAWECTRLRAVNAKQRGDDLTAWLKPPKVRERKPKPAPVKKDRWQLELERTERLLDKWLRTEKRATAKVRMYVPPARARTATRHC